MADLKDSHNHVFLSLVQTLSQHNHKDTQAIEVDGRSLDIPKVVAIARCGRNVFLPQSDAKKVQGMGHGSSSATSR